MRDGNPLLVTASGLPAGATFNDTDFSWVGACDDRSLEQGRHEIGFTAGGETTEVVVGATGYELLSFDLFAAPEEPLEGPITIPEAGQGSVMAGALFDNPFGDPSPISGCGTNAWSAFIWSIADPSVAAISTATNLAVIDGLAPGTTTVTARFTDATRGEMAAEAILDVLEVVSVDLEPHSLEFPDGSTELFRATAGLEDGTETTDIQFSWSSSNDAVATVTAGSLIFGTGHIGNVTGHAPGTVTITAAAPNAAMVSGTATATLVQPLRNQALYGMDAQGSGIRVVTIETTGGSQLLAALAAPFDGSFGPSASHTTNELLVSGFDPGTSSSHFQRIGPTGDVTPVFPSVGGDTIDPQAIEYRPDGWAYFAMFEGQQTLSRIEPSGAISNIGGPRNPGSNEGFGPTAIAAFGNDLVYSGPWSFDLSKGQTVGFADLIARFDDAANSNDSFVWAGFSFPRLAAPGGDLRILDTATGELFRFVDDNDDGDHFEIVGTSVLSAQDDPGERIAAGQLPSGFRTLTLDPSDPSTGDMITTRIVGNVPQRITVMRLRDMNGDGNVDDEGEQTVIFDAGAPPGRDIRGVLLKY